MSGQLAHPIPLQRARTPAHLESEITTLWGHITAATHRFLELVAEFDRIEGWAGDGLPSCAHWLNLHCGIGSVAAREKVRVARALETLPKIGEAFRCGQVSYSKVRAMTRVATPETQDTLLNIALHGTASHMERLVREFRKAERLEEARLAEHKHRERYLRFGYDEDESLMIYAKLPPEVGEVIKQAIEAAMALADEGSAERSASGASAESSEETNLEDPAGARRADAMRLVAEAFLAREAERCPSSADRYQVVVHIDQRLLSEGCCQHDSGPHEHGRSEIESECSLTIETARRLACDSALVGLVEDRHGDPLNVGRKTRAISPAMKRALKARDGGCRFPGCDRARFTEGHHVRHWADGGETKLSNLITLCRFHHRLVHEGGFGLQATDDGVFVFSAPDGRRLDEFGRTGQRFRGSMLPVLNAARGVTIKRAPGWHGERMQYWWAVESMQWERRVGIA
jgi:hypothetical protein